MYEIKNKKLYEELKELVADAIEMYSHGNDGIEAMEALYEFWMEHRDSVRWAYWEGPGEQSEEVIYCWNNEE